MHGFYSTKLMHSSIAAVRLILSIDPVKLTNPTTGCESIVIESGAILFALDIKSLPWIPAETLIHIRKIQTETSFQLEFRHSETKE